MRLIIVFILFPIWCFCQNSIDNAVLFLEQKKYQQAENLLISFVSNNPKNLEAKEHYGDALAYQKKWEAASTQYLELVEAKPNNANYHYKYGGALAMYAKQSNKLKALTLIGDIKNALLTAAKLDTKHLNTRWALVELYMQLPSIIGGSLEKSLQFANELQAISKVDGYLAKGYIYEYENQPIPAEKYYKMAINIGGSLTCFEKLATFYQNSNKPNKAIKTIEASQKKHQRNALHYQIGKVAASYNIQLAKGEKCLLKYLKNYTIKDGVPKAWANYRLAQIYFHKKNIQKALYHIQLAITELPDIKAFLTEKNKINNYKKQALNN
ncbi:MAG: tetratricopeptide repeat protein [Oceanihabitans sp.]